MSVRPSVRTVLPPIAGRQRSGGRPRARAHGVLQKHHACLVPPPPFVLLGGPSLLCLGTLILCITTPQASGQTNASTVAIIEAEGRVEASHPEFTLWETGPRPYTVLPGDRVRTGEHSRAVIRFTPQSTLRLGEFSLIEIPSSEEQGLTPAERSPLKDSLQAYEKGNLQQALAVLPRAREPIGAGEEVYRAALLLSVGKVSESQSRLTGLEQNTTLPPPLGALAKALRKVIAAVLHQPWSDGPPPRLRTEWMAESYYQQSQGSMDPAEQCRLPARPVRREPLAS